MTFGCKKSLFLNLLTAFPESNGAYMPRTDPSSKNKVISIDIKTIVNAIHHSLENLTQTPKYLSI